MLLLIRLRASSSPTTWRLKSCQSKWFLCVCDVINYLLLILPTTMTWRKSVCPSLALIYSCSARVGIVVVVRQRGIVLAGLDCDTIGQARVAGFVFSRCLSVLLHALSLSLCLPVDTPEHSYHSLFVSLSSSLPLSLSLLAPLPRSVYSRRSGRVCECACSLLFVFSRLHLSSVISVSVSHPPFQIAIILSVCVCAISPNTP